MVCPGVVSLTEATRVASTMTNVPVSLSAMVVDAVWPSSVVQLTAVQSVLQECCY